MKRDDAALETALSGGVAQPRDQVAVAPMDAIKLTDGDGGFAAGRRPR